MGLILATKTLYMDEPCFGLAEVNLQRPDSKGWRRWQIIWVIRDDKLTESRLDLGPAPHFKAAQFQIPGGVIDPETGRIEICHRVGELREIAEKLRVRPPLQWEPLGLLEGYQRIMEKRKNGSKRA